EGGPPEEETEPRVMRIAPEGQGPLVAVRQEKEGAFGEGALRGDEPGRASDDVRCLRDGDDRLDQVPRHDAIGVHEDQEVPPRRAAQGPSIPLPRPRGARTPARGGAYIVPRNSRGRPLARFPASSHGPAGSAGWRRRSRGRRSGRRGPR